MRLPSHLAVLIVLTGLVGLTTGPAVGVDEAGLVLTVSTPKARVSLGEPITLVSVLVNQGQRMAPVVQDLSLEAGLLQYWIRDPEGATRRYLPRGQAFIGGVPTALYPREEIAATHLLLWGPTQGHAFPAPGDYAVVATFVDSSHSLRSNLLTITVAQPEGADAEALPLILDDDAAEFLLLPSYQFERGMALVTDLLDTYPVSVYAPYAAYILAFRASRPGWFCPEPGSGRLDRIPPQYERAVAGFERVTRDWPDSVLADDAQYELARTHFEMGNQVVASDALRVFFEKFAVTSDRCLDAISLSEELGWETAYSPDSADATRWTALREAPGSDLFGLTWLPETRTARVTQGRISVEVRPGHATAILGKRHIPLTAAPLIEDGRLLVPTAFAQLLPRLLTRGRQLEPIPLPHLPT